MPLSCIMYDLDGTLIDSAADIAIAVNQVRSHYSLEALDEFEVRCFIGDGAKKLIERSIFGIVDDPVMRPAQRLPKIAADIDEVVAQFRDIYSEDPVIETTVAKGAAKVLKKWQAEGVAQVCLTNKPHSITLNVLEQLHLIEFFDLVVGAGALDDDGNVLPTKPDAAVIDYVLDQTGAAKEESVVVGDGLPDIQVAKNAGIDCVALLNGYTDTEVVLEEAADLDLVATSFEHAGEILDQLNAKT